ncbi:MAG: PEPxxWA-CTERM sorting domain-containing protein, partial [Sphingomicrobium sp.]
LGSTGMTAGSSTGGVSSTITNNTTVPNTISFITTNAAAGTDTSFIDFIEDYASVGTFSVTTATNPSSTVTLINVLTGEMVPLDSGTYGASAGSNSGSSYSLNLTTNLAANTWYRFFYTADMAKPGDITGTASFDVAPVPEPATWAMMLLGFAGIGVSLRRRRPGLAQVA